MNRVNKSKLFAVFVFALIVLMYAAVAPLGHAQENMKATRTRVYYKSPS
jgi:hypothetical protein